MSRNGMILDTRRASLLFHGGEVSFTKKCRSKFYPERVAKCCDVKIVESLELPPWSEVCTKHYISGLHGGTPSGRGGSNVV